MRVDDLYFSVGDMEYWYEVHGEGIPIVLLHGFTGSSSTWQRFVRACPSGFKLVTVDLPGHGRTSGEQIKSMDACISDLQQLFKSLQLEQFILVGYSMGGRTALSYTIKYPENVAGLVLESASPGLFDAAAREERKNKDEQLALRIEEEGVTAFIDYWENIPLFQTQKQLSKENQLAIRKERIEQTAIGLANSLRGMGTGSQASNWDALIEVKIPVLLLVGELDSKFIEINQRMKQNLPMAELEIFSSAGHALHIEKPASFLESVLAFANSYRP